MLHRQCELSRMNKEPKYNKSHQNFPTLESCSMRYVVDVLEVFCMFLLVSAVENRFFKKFKNLQNKEIQKKKGIYLPTISYNHQR